MGYTISREAVYQAKEYLDEICNAVAQGKSITFKVGNPKAFAYILHNAIKAGNVLGIEPYCSLDVRIKQQDSDKVIVSDRGRKPYKITMDVAGRGTVHTHTQEKNEFEVVSVLSKIEDFNIHVFPNFGGNVVFIRNWISKKNFIVLSYEPLSIRKNNDKRAS